MLSEVLRRDTLSQAGRARAAKKKPQSDAFWSLFGDAVFALLVLSSVAWGLASIGHYKGWWDISSYLGENYDRDGFCLAHKGTWYESQLLSMYFSLCGNKPSSRLRVDGDFRRYGSVVLAFVLQVMVRSLAGNRGELLVVDGNSAATRSPSSATAWATASCTTCP